MMFKPAFLFDWDPVIFHNGRAYIIGNGHSDGHLKMQKKNYNLVKLDNIEVYEGLFFDHSREEIRAYQNEFLEATVNQQMRENSAAQQALNENEVLSFIIREVLPALTRKKENEEIDNLLGVKEEQEENPSNNRDVNINLGDLIGDINVRQDNELVNRLIRMVEMEYAGDEQDIRKDTSEQSRIEQLLRGQFNYKKSQESRYVEDQIAGILEGHSSKPVRREYVESNTDDSILSKLLPGSVAVFGGRVYDLVPASEKSNFVIYLGNDRYTTNWSKPLSDLHRTYNRLLEKKIKIDALRENGTQASALAQAQREREALKEILQMNEFEKAGVGFLRKRGLYYVYVETPEKYALKSSENGKYYLFGKTKIGVSLKKDHDRIYANDPLILGNYHHPFIRGPGSDLKICLGEYGYDRTRNLPPLESVLTFLSDAKNVILSGYMAGCAPHRRLHSDNFFGQEISESQIKKDKIPVTNKAVVRGRYR